MSIVNQSIVNLDLIPNQNLTPEFYLNFVKTCPEMVPECLFSDIDFVTKMVKIDGSLLCYAGVKTLGLCLDAVMSNPLAINFVPEEFLPFCSHGFATND